MKIFPNIIITGVIMTMAACSPTYRYQVFNNKSLDNSNKVYFENTDIKIEYNLWSEDGHFEYSLTNKTTTPLFLDLLQSALVVNGITFPTYRETEISTSVSATMARSATYLNQSGYLVSPGASKGISLGLAYKSDPIVYLPAKSTYKGTIVFGNWAQIYESPDAKLKRSEKKKSLPFSKERTPYLFRFNIGYATHKDMQAMNYIDNEFWVESIEIIREKEFLGKSVFNENSQAAAYSLPYKKKSAFYLKARVPGSSQ